MSKIRQTVGENIRLFRKTRGLTQEKLAEIVGVSGSYIGYLERGQKCPSLDLLSQIANTLQTDPATLLTSADNTKKQELKKLVAILSDQEPKVLKFLNEVVTAYLKSLK